MDAHPLQEQIRQRAEELRERADALITELEDVETELAALQAAEREFVRGLARKVKRERLGSGEQAGAAAPGLDSPPQGESGGAPLPSRKPPKPPAAKRAEVLAMALAKLAAHTDDEGWMPTRKLMEEVGCSHATYGRAMAVLREAGAVETRGSRQSLFYRKATSGAEKAQDAPPDPPEGRGSPEPPEAPSGPESAASSKSDGIEKPGAAQPDPPPAARIELVDGDYDIVDVLSSSGAGALTASGIAVKLKVPAARVSARLQALTSAGYLARGLNGVNPVFGIAKDLPRRKPHQGV